MNKFMSSVGHPSLAMLEDLLAYSLAFLFCLPVFIALTNLLENCFESNKIIGIRGDTDYSAVSNKPTVC